MRPRSCKRARSYGKPRALYGHSRVAAILAGLPSRCQTTGQSRPSMLGAPVLLAARLFGRVCRAEAKLAPRSLREPGHGGLGPGTAGIEEDGEDQRAQSAQGEARTAGPLAGH